MLWASSFGEGWGCEGVGAATTAFPSPAREKGTSPQAAAMASISTSRLGVASGLTISSVVAGGGSLARRVAHHSG